MGYLILSIIILALLFVWAFYTNSFSLSKSEVGACKWTHLIFGVLGAVVCLTSVVLFLTNLAGIDGTGEENEVIRDSFILFAFWDLLFIFLGVGVCSLCVLLSSKLCPLIPPLLFMWSTLSFFWTVVCTVWSDYKALDIRGYILVFGIGCAMISAFSSAFLLWRRHEFVKDSANIERINKEKREKALEKERRLSEKKRAIEKKKRLKNPKKHIKHIK